MRAVPFVRYSIEVARHAREAAAREPAALAGWVEEFGDPETTLAAFPDQPDNGVARELIELARPLGVDLRRWEGKQRVVVERPGDRAVGEAITEYTRTELEKTRPEFGPPPPVLEAHLEGCRQEIDAVVRLLSDSPPPAWEMRLSAGFEAPTPNMTGQIRLQRVLAAEALRRALLGQMREAEAVLRASWALNSSLRDRPELISQLMAISIARMEAGLLRRLPVDPVSWGTRLAEQDYRASVLLALEVESIRSLRTLPVGSSVFDRASRADYLDSRRRFLARLRRSPVSDGPIPDVRPEPLSPGAIIEAMVAPNFVEAVHRANHLIVDTELTERVLALRALKMKLGRWPDTFSGLTGSRLESAEWKFSVLPDGRLEIALSREPNWEGRRGMSLPVRFQTD